jgi:hypothetical protein
MNDQRTQERDQGQALLDALTALVDSQELRMMVGNSTEAGAVHLVIPRTLVLRTQTMNAAHLSGSG